MSTDEIAASLDETLAPSSTPRQPRRSRLVGLDGRYVDLGPLAAGGMGELHRIRDTRFGRVIVLKVLKPALAEHVDAQRRFEHEARITALLEHPGVVAVHDRGRLWDGRPWFAMQEVRGRTLAELIDAIHKDAPPNRFNLGLDGWTFRRLVEALGRVARTIAYAHKRRVVHRDIKPDNIMVGAFGEVLVMDWGIAWEICETPPGDIIGTPAYMPPEQAQGRMIGTSADVYALGATLYALMAGTPPYRTLDAVREGPPPPVTRVQPERRLPAPLVDLCHRAMAREANARPTADGVARALEDWLDGVARREKALELVATADALRPTVDALYAQSATLSARAQAALAALPAKAPVEDKFEAWRMEDAALEQARAAELADVEYLQSLQGALNLVSDLSEARARLASHQRAAVSRAEHAGRFDAVARHEALLRAYDDGQHAQWLAGDGTVTLHTDPAGASVTLYRVVEVHRRRVLKRVGPLGQTPLDAAPLGRGDWVLRIAHPGRVDVDYPVRIERGTHWSGVAPGDTAPTPIALPAVGALPDDACYVPAGWFVAGGDAAAPEALSRRRFWLDGFVIGRDPVCHGEYRDFLQALIDAGEPDALRRFAPTGTPGTDTGQLATLGPDGKVRYQADRGGREPALDSPIIRVDVTRALAFLRWKAARSGHPMRLPHSLEWEKAARGTDARFFSWGNHFDANWTWAMDSQTDQPWLTAIDRHPVDVSPYGVRGMTGNARDWCRDRFTLAGPPGPRVPATEASPETADLLLVRGGSWNSVPAYCRLAVRFALNPGRSLSSVGFRWSFPFG